MVILLLIVIAVLLALILVFLKVLNDNTVVIGKALSAQLNETIKHLKRIGGKS